MFIKNSSAGCKTEHKIYFNSIKESFSCIFFIYHRGLILFGDKAYILEPLEGATNEHVIYEAMDLKIAPGSCGHHRNISGATLQDTVQSIRTFTGRVSGE